MSTSTPLNSHENASSPPTKRRCTEADTLDAAQSLHKEGVLEQRIVALEAECNMWRSRAEGSQPLFPATQWPDLKPPERRGGHDYPSYDLAQPKQSFLKICDMLIEDIVGELPSRYEMPAREVAWVRRMLDFNVRGGKMNRGLMVVESGVRILESMNRPVSNDAVVRLAILGWCIEWMQGWLLMADDFMDDSQTRRGQKCWYLHDDVQKIAINDAFMLEMIVFKVLKRHFASEPYYAQLLDLFLETTFQTECGQLLDTLCMNLELADFTVDRWTCIVKYKTAFYSFYASVACGMIVAGVTEVAEYNACREILLMMGVYFQAQDDFLDCFGTPEQIGKIGTDIQDKKCGWLFAHAYHHLANPGEKATFDKLYGKCKVQSAEEAQIKQLYEQLGLRELYQRYEQESYDQIVALKDTVKQVPWVVFDTFLKKIYKRER